MLDRSAPMDADRAAESTDDMEVLIKAEIKAENPLEIDALCHVLDQQLSQFEHEIKLCEEHVAANCPGHRYSTDLTAWRDAFSDRYEEVDDVSPSLIFFARCALGYLCSGSISEKELRLAVIDSCKRSEVRVNNRGGLSGSQVDLSIICGVLQTVGVLDEEKKSKQTRRPTPTAAGVAEHMLTAASLSINGSAGVGSAVMSQAVDTAPITYCELPPLGPLRRVGEALSVKTDWSEGPPAQDGRPGAGGTELRKGFNDALDAAGDLSASYYDPTGGVDAFVLNRFRDRISEFIAGLQSKIKHAAAAAVAAEAAAAAAAADLSGDLSIDGDADLSIGIGIDMGARTAWGLDSADGGAHGHSAAVFDLEDDALLFDASVPLDTLAGSGVLDMLSLDDLSQPMVDSHPEPDSALPLDHHMHHHIEQQMDFQQVYQQNSQPEPASKGAILPASSMEMAEEVAPLAVLAGLLSRKEESTVSAEGAVPPMHFVNAAELIASHSLANSSRDDDLMKYSLALKASKGISALESQIKSEAESFLGDTGRKEDDEDSTPPIRLPSYTEASLVARGYKKRKIEAMCISLRHVYTNGLFFKEEFNGVQMAASSMFGCNSWENLTGPVDGMKSPASGEAASDGADGQTKPKRGRRPKIRLPISVATVVGMDDMATPVASTPVSPITDGNVKKPGTKSFNSNFGSRVWRMNHEMDRLFFNPPLVFLNWAEACHQEACADELEEAALRRLVGCLGVGFPVEQLQLGTKYLEPLPKLEPIVRPPSEYFSIKAESPEPEPQYSDAAKSMTPLASQQASSAARRKNGLNTPATLNADTLLLRFKKRGNPNYTVPILSLRDNKTVQFKSPVKLGPNTGLLSSEDVMIDGEVASYPTAMLPVMHHRKRAKSVSAVNGPSPAEITARHQPAPMSLHVWKEAPPTEQDVTSWEAVCRNIAAANGLNSAALKRRREDEDETSADESLVTATAGDPDGPKIYLPKPLETSTPSGFGLSYPPLNSSIYHGRYITVPDMILHTEPMHWMAMAAEFSLLGDTIVGEQSLLYSSGGDHTPGGSTGQRTPSSDWRGFLAEDESDEIDEEELSESDAEADEFISTMDIISPEGESPSRRSSRQIQKSVSEASLASAVSSGSIVSSIGGLADAISKQVVGSAEKPTVKTEGVLKTSKPELKKRKHHRLTINVPSASHSRDDGPESGRYSTRKFAAVQSPSFRTLSPVPVISGPAVSADSFGVKEPPNGNGSSSGEDTSDEAYTSRHDFVLGQMRDRLQTIAALRKEQKEQRKKEKTGRFSTAAQNIAAHNAKRRMSRTESMGSDGDMAGDLARRKRTGSIVPVTVSAEALLVNSPRKRVPVNREIEFYAPPQRAPRRDHSAHSRMHYDSDGNPIMRKRGRPLKAPHLYYP